LRAVSQERLRRAPRALRRLPAEDQAALQQLLDAVSQALVDLLVEEGEHDAALAAVLTSIYGPPTAPL
jgi:hypothetical protein